MQENISLFFQQAPVLCCSCPVYFINQDVAKETDGELKAQMRIRWFEFHLLKCQEAYWPDTLCINELWKTRNFQLVENFHFHSQEKTLVEDEDIWGKKKSSVIVCSLKHHHEEHCSIQEHGDARSKANIDALVQLCCNNLDLRNE